MNIQDKLVQMMFDALGRTDRDLVFRMQELVTEQVKADENIALLMARSERDDVIRAAARLANALSDINNDIGDLPEVKKAFERVEYDVSTYAGLDEV